MRLHHLLRSSAERFPNVEAVRDEDGARTFAELADRVARLASGLTTLGVRPAQRVVILSKNRCEFVELYFALFEVGAVAVPVNWRLRPREVELIVRDAESTLVFAEVGLAPLLEPCGDLARVAIGGEQGGWSSYESLCGAPSAAATPADGDDTDVGVQMYTSGTTGRAKGSMLTHHNVSSLVTAWLQDMPLEPGDRFLQVTPLFHVGALLMMTSTVAAGATLRVLPEFVAPRALAVLRDERITQALFVPAMVQWLLAEKDVRQHDYAALRMLVYGAAPMPVRVLEEAIEVFGCDFLQGYGLTETAGVLTSLRAIDHRYPSGTPPPRRLASIGRSVGCCEVRVVDSEGAEARPDAVGELVARGDNVHAGYWKLPDGDATSDGWFHTGDLATVDAEGFLYLVDRLKDMICVAGENVYPREIEDVLRDHDAVADVAVIGIPHRHWGEEVLALVVRASGGDPGDRELIQHCRARLARFKCPTRVEWRDDIPRNAAGKTLKRELRAPYWADRERKV